MFVVDDLVGWLIGRLADAGYKKLTTLLRGSDQARALKEAVTAAVQATVGEIGPFDREEAERVAEQINKAFGRREPVPLPPGQPTLLEALQAGIAGKLSVLDDAGQPVVSLPGVPVSDVAALLTSHLVREIQIRGSRGGPLTPLAGQLNDDLTHLHVQRIEGQGQRIEGMLAQVLDWLGDALALPGGAAGPLGSPLADVRDPFALEVHRPLEPDVPQPGLPALPVYVPRKHDAALREVVTAAAAGGTGGIAVLVGGSSTGKTRACWQALDLLRDLEPGWRLWHPTDTQAALAGLPGVWPRTVVWLNEAQRYLDTSDSTGERLAAGLRTLLRDRAQGPVLVLATLWTEFWAQLTIRPPQGADPHAQARELLAGHNIRVPSDFTHEELRELEAAGDPRLTQAAAGSRDGQVIQYLAGAPDLLDRYHHAPTGARALIDAAMDARRLGVRSGLPRAFLETAAPGYLTDTEWDLLPGDWLKQALDYTAAHSKGVRGPLAPIRPRPAAGVPADLGDEPAWQLADYLDQHGRRARQDQLGPASLWDALTTHAASSSDLTRLGEAAEFRGLYRHAAALWTAAAMLGSAGAAGQLITLLGQVSPGDTTRAARWAASHAELDDAGAAAALLFAMREAGTDDAVQALLARDQTLATWAARHAGPDHPARAAQVARALRELGAGYAVTALAISGANHPAVVNPWQAADRLRRLHEIGAGDTARALATPAANRAPLDDPPAVRALLEALHEIGADDAVTALAARATNTGMFLVVHPGEATRYRFGREPDGAPSQPWNWREPASQNSDLRPSQPGGLLE